MLWVFLKASMLSSGGLQALPLLREDLIVAHPWLTNADFATAIAIGRITPGPNGLFTLSVGYFLGGFAGVIAAFLGLTLPPFLAIGLVRAHRRLAHRPWITGATRGITAASIGLLSALGYSFTAPLIGSWASMLILVVSLAVLVFTKVDALPVLIGGGLAGLAFYALGVPLA